MKKISGIILILVLVVALSACSTPSSVAPVAPTDEKNVPTTEAKEEKPAVITVRDDEVHYFCEQCQGNCTYYTGRFRCPSVDRTSADALAINAEIKTNYEKYVAVANAVSVSGLAYGFDFVADCEDAKYVILRTAVETVLLHSGGTYSYDFYYYDLEKDCKADIADICRHFALDAEVIISYIRLELADAGAYSDAQLQSISAECLDLYPLGNNSYYVRVQNDQVKYEFTLDADDLNSRGAEIASLRLQTEEPGDSATAESGEAVSEQTTAEQDVIYMDYE